MALIPICYQLKLQGLIWTFLSRCLREWIKQNLRTGLTNPPMGFLLPAGFAKASDGFLHFTCNPTDGIKKAIDGPPSFFLTCVNFGRNTTQEFFLLNFQIFIPPLSNTLQIYLYKLKPNCKNQISNCCNSKKLQQTELQSNPNSNHKNWTNQLLNLSNTNSWFLGWLKFT